MIHPIQISRWWRYFKPKYSFITFHCTFSPVRWNHLTGFRKSDIYITACILIGSLLIFAGGNIAYIDALVFAGGSCTGAGLNPIDLDNLTTWQQVVPPCIALIRKSLPYLSFAPSAMSLSSILLWSAFAYIGSKNGLRISVRMHNVLLEPHVSVEQTNRMTRARRRATVSIASGPRHEHSLGSSLCCLLHSHHRRFASGGSLFPRLPGNIEWFKPGRGARIGGRHEWKPITSGFGGCLRDSQHPINIRRSTTVGRQERMPNR